MGLAERRAARKFQTEILPIVMRDIHAAVGFELPVTIHWEELSVVGYAHMFDDAWMKVYFLPLLKALQAIAVDDLGRDALKTGLKAVVIMNRGGVYYPDAMPTFRDGVLTLDHEPCTNIEDVDERAKAIQAVLEQGL